MRKGWARTPMCSCLCLRAYKEIIFYHLLTCLGRPHLCYDYVLLQAAQTQFSRQTITKHFATSFHSLESCNLRD